MGPSGCGKTTLLDVLALRNISDEIRGTIHINGKSRSQSYMKRMSAYVLQSDVLLANLSVQETLIYTVELRAGIEISADEKLRRVFCFYSRFNKL